MAIQVLIGTTNPSKLRMFREWLGEYPVELVTLFDLGITDEPTETGNTPTENARLKAEYYGRFADYCICQDSGLYLDALPLEDPRQPGLHIRTPEGRKLDDEEMITYYSRLAGSLGGRVMAYYLDGFAVKTPEGIQTYMKTREEARSGAFWLTDTPSEKRRPGWPLDSISLMPDGSYFLDNRYKLKSKPCNDTNTKKAWVRFLAQALGL
ncbi:MAG: non-canonical purine NTP pyrophosphatase [Clostridiales bacterium]|nr:non-canonical purine NTP pyrophosphatase [Clostridiales bacterium]